MTPSYKLREVLKAAGFAPEQIFLPDTDYQLPDEKYMRDLGNRYTDFILKSGLRYIEEQFDCDNFALQAVAHAKLEQGLYGTQGADIAVGQAWGEHATAGPHAFIVAIHRIDGELAVKFYEPQTCLTEIKRSDLSALWFCCF